jgi:HEAT repeat protein
MKTMTKRAFAGLMILAAVCVAVPRASAAPPTEDKVAAELASPKEGTAIDGLADVEKYFPTSPTLLPTAKKLLADPRNKVARKAAYVLGNVHADVSDDDLKNICRLLSSADKTDVVDALKGLRGLKAQSVIPQIVPLLKNPDKNIMRDACRTLAVLGNKSLIPDIQPLLTYPDLGVQKDAADAIEILKEKP